MKFIISTIFFLGTCLLGQSLGIGQSSFKETGLIIKDFQAEWSPHTLKDNVSFNIRFGEFRFGFKDFRLSYDDAADNQYFDLEISGPEFHLSHFSLTMDILAKDWIKAERIKRLQKLNSAPNAALLTLSLAIDLFWEDYDRYPNSYDELAIKNYIDPKIFPFTEQSWTYTFDLPEKLTAYPTQFNHFEYPPIVYDWSSKLIISGNKQMSTSKIDIIPWEISFQIPEISNTISTRTMFKFTPDHSHIDFFQKHGKFQIKGLAFSLTPKNYLSNQIRFSIPDFSIELNQIAVSGDLGSEPPKIHKGKGKISIRNFEIKIPEELSRDPEIEYMLERMGIWNNALKVRLFELSLNLLNDHTGEIDLIFNSPFMKIELDGDFSVRLDGIHPEFLLHQMEVKIHPISLGIRKWIREWEKENGRTLNRRGATIIIKIDGPLTNPVIHGYK